MSNSNLINFSENNIQNNKIEINIIEEDNLTANNNIINNNEILSYNIPSQKKSFERLKNLQILIQKHSYIKEICI